MDLEIRHLRVVAAIAETGSISRASALLGHTQPAVTAQLQRIERALGGLLFARDGSGAKPTALGAMVVSHAQGIIALHDELLRDVRRRDADADLSTVRLGATAGPMAAALVTVSRQLLPEAEVSLHVSDSDEELIELLAESRLEIGLSVDYPGYELPVPEELSEAVLIVEPVFVLLAADHPSRPTRKCRSPRWPASNGCLGTARTSGCARCSGTPAAVRVSRLDGSSGPTSV